ncbi:hypothetical protein ACP70R_008405 [Stipagrostis hirtigluma subsp. patula]
MASAAAAAATICVALVLLSMVHPPAAMAADSESCRAACVGACRLFANATCRGVSTSTSCLTSDQCFWKLINVCGPTCYTGCTSPAPPAGTSCCTHGYMSDGTPCLSY